MFGFPPEYYYTIILFVRDTIYSNIIPLNFIFPDGSTFLLELSPVCLSLLNVLFLQINTNQTVSL